jgi:hypothetical protein
MTKSEWLEWLDWPATKEFLSILKDRRQSLLELLHVQSTWESKCKYDGQIDNIDAIFALIEELKSGN